MPTSGVERNYGYMAQWWGIAAAAVVFGLYAARRAAKNANRVESKGLEDGDAAGNGQTPRA